MNKVICVLGLGLGLGLRLLLFILANDRLKFCICQRYASTFSDTCDRRKFKSSVKYEEERRHSRWYAHAEPTTFELNMWDRGCYVNNFLQRKLVVIVSAALGHDNYSLKILTAWLVDVSGACRPVKPVGRVSGAHTYVAFLAGKY